MRPYVVREFFNPSAIYREGARIRQAIDDARTRVARLVHAGARDVVFTSGGTESDNLAILGAYEALKDTVAHPRIVVFELDHPAILEAAREAERRGAELVRLEKTPDARIDPEHIRAALTDSTILVSLSYVHGETGTAQAVSKIGRSIREFRKQRGTRYPFFHVDASQAANHFDLNADTLQADLVTIDGAKIYGPKGSGALIVRPTATIRPRLLGGAQERGLRAGTENVPGICGFAKALELAVEKREAEAGRLEKLREIFVRGISEVFPEAVIEGSKEHAAPHIISVSFPGKLHEFIAIKLDKEGVLVSTGTSCSSQKNTDDAEAIRFSFGRKTTRRDVQKALKALEKAVRD